MIFLLIICLIGPTWAEEEEEEVPFLTLNIVLKAWLTPFGLGAEALFGHLGIGGTFTVLFFGTPDGNSFYLYEPGVYAHFYLFDPAASLYIAGDVSFTMIGITVGGEEVINSADYDSGILNLKGGVGFNAFFGKDNKVHFSVELGVHYFNIIIHGEEIPFEEYCCTPVLPYFQLQFGMGLF